MIFQTYGVSSHHDGHSYVCSMDLWFLLRTVCCNCCKRSDIQHSLLCSLCSVPVLQWPQKMTSQCQHVMVTPLIHLNSCVLAHTLFQSHAILYIEAKNMVTEPLLKVYYQRLSYFSNQTYVVETQKNLLLSKYN